MVRQLVNSHYYMYVKAVSKGMRPPECSSVELGRAVELRGCQAQVPTT